VVDLGDNGVKACVVNDVTGNVGFDGGQQYVLGKGDVLVVGIHPFVPGIFDELRKLGLLVQVGCNFLG
jgi:hypothetical protein